MCWAVIVTEIAKCFTRAGPLLTLRALNRLKVNTCFTNEICEELSRILSDFQILTSAVKKQSGRSDNVHSLINPRPSPIVSPQEPTELTLGCHCCSDRFLNLLPRSNKYPKGCNLFTNRSVCCSIQTMEVPRIPRHPMLLALEFRVTGPFKYSGSPFFYPITDSNSIRNAIQCPLLNWDNKCLDPPSRPQAPQAYRSKVGEGRQSAAEHFQTSLEHSSGRRYIWLVTINPLSRFPSRSLRAEP